MSELPLVSIVDGIDTEDVCNVLNGIATVQACNKKTIKQLDQKTFDETIAILCHHWADLNGENIAKFKKLKLIVRYGVGLDNVDIKAATKQGIPVCYVPTFGVEEVADTAMAHVLNLFRRTHQAAVKVQAGVEMNEIDEIRGAAMGARRIRGKTMGIMGLGRIGTAVSIRAKAFGFNVCFYDPFIPPGYEKALGITTVDCMEDLMRQSDCLVLTMALNNTNKHCVNALTIELMPKDAVIVNVSRGGLIDDKALAEALNTGRLGGAGFDVHENEPHNPTAKGRIFYGVPNMACTPHTAWYSAESQVELFTSAAMEVKRMMDGKPFKNCVNAKDLGLN